MKNSHAGVLRLIAVFKMLKATLLIVTAIGILKMMHSDVAATMDHWIARLGLDPGNRYVDLLMSKAANISPDKIKELGIASFVYAALFLTEGIGLWLLKRWAEWFTIVITASLVPLEVWEIFRHPSAGKILVLIINVAVVIYLIYRVRKDDPDRQEKVALAQNH
ncbi:MAG: DUF2127 domain-containing protein [Acidobacteriaceae bacterium]